MDKQKSAQTGVNEFWRLYANDNDPKICPVRALIRLRIVYGSAIKPTGPLFLQISPSGAVVVGTPVVFIPKTFLYGPRSSLIFQTKGIIDRAVATYFQAIAEKDWALFGTHSFRRGGCQDRLENCRWSPAMVAAWGGWSQLEAVTMFRYFYSPHDNSEKMIEYDSVKRQRIL